MPPTRTQLEEMKRTELCDYCRQHNIPGYSGKTKAERVKLILDFYKVPKFERPLPRRPKKMDKKQVKRSVKKSIKEGKQRTLFQPKTDYGYEINSIDFGRRIAKDYLKDGIRTRVFYTKDGEIDSVERLN